MLDRDPERNLDRRPVLAAVAISAGIIAIVLPFFWPGQAFSRANWSIDEAKQYQAASIKLHSLSHASLHASSNTNPQAMRKELQQAEADYNAIRSKLDSATARPAHVALPLRLSGIALLAIGAFALYFGRTPGRSPA